MLLYYLVGVLFLVLVHSQDHQQPMVETSLGLIRGYHKRSYGGRTFSAFEGIPYAKPPIGGLRFEEPRNIETWFGVWDATIQHECLQLKWPFSDLVVTGQEDCLYINVYVPRDEPVPNENLDVVVGIHGGGFKMGNPDIAGPGYLMDRDIIYVNLNFRLGVLGFLSTEDNVVPGNNGMKDQVLALKWIQNHIEPFGGNPKSVTVMGTSTGAASVHLLYFSPLTKGLFHRGISNSGTALTPTVIQKAALEKAKALAASIGCDHLSTKRLVECLKQRSAWQLIQISNKFSPFNGYPFMPFAPVIEKESKTEESKTAFLTSHPYKLLKRSQVIDVPWITSVTTEEGIFAMSGVFSLANKLDDVEKHWNEGLPHYLDYNYTVADVDQTAIAQKIKEFYFGEEKVSHKNVQTLIRLFGDRYFYLHFEKSARMQAKQISSSTYAYVYGYKPDHNFTSLSTSKRYGVGHGDDELLFYQSTRRGVPSKEDKLSQPDERIKELLLDIIVSFAKNGKPNVEGVNWNPVTDSSDFQYLFINNDGVKMVSEKEVAPTEFWSSLPLTEHENVVKDEL